MTALRRVRAACAGLMLLLALGSSAGARPTPADEARADAALQPIEKRVGADDAAKLRRELLALRVAHPGTAAAMKAAALLARLPSPLDRLDPKAIPALERFDWQAPELVAILGDHRGRHGAPVTS